MLLCGPCVWLCKVSSLLFLLSIRQPSHLRGPPLVLPDLYPVTTNLTWDLTLSSHKVITPTLLASPWVAPLSKNPTILISYKQRSQNQNFIYVVNRTFKKVSQIQLKFSGLIVVRGQSILVLQIEFAMWYRLWNFCVASPTAQNKEWKSVSSVRPL